MAVQPPVRIAVVDDSTDDHMLVGRTWGWSVLAIACGYAVLNLEERQPIES